MESKKEKILWQSLKILKQTTRQQRHRHSCDCASVLQIPILVSLGIQSFPLVLGNILDDVLGDLQKATKREQEKASLRDEQFKTHLAVHSLEFVTDVLGKELCTKGLLGTGRLGATGNTNPQGALSDLFVTHRGSCFFHSRLHNRHIG